MHERDLIHKAVTAGDLSEEAATGTADVLSVRDINFSSEASDRTQFPSDVTIPSVSVIEQPISFRELYARYERSAFLPAMVGAMRANVYTTGFTLDPYVDPSDPKSGELLADAIVWEKLNRNGDPETLTLEDDAIPDVTPKQIDMARKRFEKRYRAERTMGYRAFNAAVPDGTPTELWDYTGQDLEVTGNAWWEIRRHGQTGRPVRFQWVPAITVWAARGDMNYVPCTKWVRNNALSWSKVPQYRRFDRWVQIRIGKNMEGIVVAWFKEFGDPRVMSRRSGEYYRSLQELAEKEANALFKRNLSEEQLQQELEALAATELLHHRNPHGGAFVYGMPEWVGATPSVLSSRELDEENLKITKDEVIPQLIIAVSGGTVGSKAFSRFEEGIKNRQKGRKGIMLIEAQAASKGLATGAQQQAKIDVIKLKSEQHNDAFGQKLDQRNEEKILGTVRMPRAVLGRDIGQNRATTQIMERFAQNQIFAPRRRCRIEDPMNEKLLPEMGLFCLTYHANVIEMKDPELRANIIKTLTTAGVLTVEEGRRLSAPIFNEVLVSLGSLWSKLPPTVLTTMLQTKNRELAAVLLSNDTDKMQKLAVAMEQLIGRESQGGQDGQVDQEGAGPQGPPAGEPSADPEA